MKIYLHEIKDQETELNFDQSEPWVAQAVTRLDEKGDDEPESSLRILRGAKTQPAAPRAVDAHFSLRRVDDIFLVSGGIKTSINLVCSRCAKLYPFKTQPQFSALFCKDPVMAGVGHLAKPGKPAGQNKGFARHAHDDSEDTFGTETGRDLDITYISEDFIDLADVLTEQLQLQIPFQPLCSDDCKGMCPQCGTDWNSGRCACAKITRQHPFSVLKDLKLN